MPSKESKKDMNTAKKDLAKKFGDGAVVILGEEEPIPVECISTGLISLDYAIRRPNAEKGMPIGGIPKGRITELFGPEGGGKSSLLMKIIAQMMKVSKRYAAYVDVEHTFDPIYARDLGVDTKNLAISQPSCGEEALDIVDTLVKSDAVDIVVVDSVAMLTPKVEIEAEIGDAHVGARARLVSQAIAKLVPVLQHHDVAVVFLNQLRDIIGFTGYGATTNTPCGRSLKHNASLRIEIKRMGMLKISDRNVGAQTKFRIAKNKLGSPFNETKVDLIFGRGFCEAGDLIDFGVEVGALRKSGATFEFAWSEEKFTNGREAFRKNLLESATLSLALQQEILKRVA